MKKISIKRKKKERKVTKKKKKKRKKEKKSFGRPSIPLKNETLGMSNSKQKMMF
jgi:hypothetical protein